MKKEKAISYIKAELVGKQFSYKVFYSEVYNVDLMVQVDDLFIHGGEMVFTCSYPPENEKLDAFLTRIGRHFLTKDLNDFTRRFLNVSCFVVSTESTIVENGVRRLVKKIVLSDLDVSR